MIEGNIKAKRIDSKFEYVHCAYCGQDDTEQVLEGIDRLTNNPGTFSVVRCKQCGFVYTNPRPYGEYLLKFYPDEYGPYIPISPIFKSPTDLMWKQSLKRILYKIVLKEHFGYYPEEPSRIFFKILSFPFKKRLLISLTPSYITNGKVLEIGCAYGLRLLKLKELGWQVQGVEVGEKPSAYAREQGLDVISASIENLKFPDKSFDVVIMSMVLEHLPDPVYILSKIKSWLKPPGQLLISIPNFSGIEFKLFKKYCYGLQVPSHFYFFTPETINVLLKDFHIKILYQYFERDIVASMQYYYNEHPNSPMRYFLKLPRVIYKLLVRFFSLLNMTSRISLKATKNVS